MPYLYDMMQARNPMTRWEGRSPSLCPADHSAGISHSRPRLTAARGCSCRYVSSLIFLPNVIPITDGLNLVRKQSSFNRELDLLLTSAYLSVVLGLPAQLKTYVNKSAVFKNLELAQYPRSGRPCPQFGSRPGCCDSRQLLQ
ncbi:hypothetical protein CTI12_AA538910 [Artemisia annua]|uniref:Uncharacterized protein n=1 Tax=Artemisia annua TaxID=35608 RepID=A0A2U1L271_ARTAN|nr:hypothetical protein CTI12_AA538910 [Artemisia annua]